MTKPDRTQRVASLRRLLLWWIVGSGVVLVLIYTNLLEYYLDLGVTLRTKSALEQAAFSYAQEYQANEHASLPEGPGLKSYRAIADMPEALREMFPVDSYQHGEIQHFINIDFDDQEETPADRLHSLCDGSPCQLILFYSHQLNPSDWLYMSQGLVITEKEDRALDFNEEITFYIALTVLALFAVLAFLLVQRIGQPVRQLANWADSLTLDHIDGNVPDFQYKELNLVADRLDHAFKRMAQSVEKEHRFLQHASHELRTPIAIASGNLEILDKLANQDGSKNEPERLALGRLGYAVKDMKQLTETLLWLNTDNESLPTPEQVKLNTLIDALIDDHEYLLQHKAIKVVVVGPAVDLQVPLILCRIVVANLIRNAFQYTQEGRVQIAISEESININNEGTDIASPAASGSVSDYGFGLGLALVEQIAQRLGWRYHYERKNNGRSSTIFFES